MTTEPYTPADPSMGELRVLDASNLTIPLHLVKQRTVPHFTKEEMNQLLSKVPPKQAMIFQFLWRTGCRVSEVVQLRVRDLNFKDDEITIRWLKNRKFDFRVIPMHKSLKQPLYLFTAHLKADERVFPFTRQMVDKLCKQYRFGHAHLFRHSFAVNFIRQSDRPMALVELQELLGHSNIRTTMEYLKVVPENQKKALDKIDFD